MFRDDPLQAGDTQASSCRRGRAGARAEAAFSFPQAP